VGSLKSIAKHMKLGRQEDAHEFTRYFIDSMVKSSLIGYERFVIFIADLLTNE
jgi:hypothetical protein